MARRSASFRPAPLLALVAVALLGTGCITVDVLGGARKPLVESVVAGERGPKILLLEVDGPITEVAQRTGLLGPLEENMVGRLREQLDKAREDDQIRAVVLRINSPGGTVTGSDLIYREILRFKQEREVPVVAQMMGVAASGGYYVAMAADRVVAHPTTVTGSIGVIFVGVNLSGLMQKLGVTDQTMKAGAFKDAGSMLRPMEPAERAQLQSVLDDMHARFKSVVASGRQDIDPKRLDRLADGRIFSASQALKSGLVDELGDLDSTVSVTEELAGLSESRLVAYHRPREWVQNYYARTPTVPSELRIELGSPFDVFRKPGFLYLWMPGQ